MMDLESEFGNVLEMGYGIIVSVGEHTGFHSDGICSESWFGNIPEMMGESCVPLHFVCGCASTCDSSMPLFIVLNWDNECLTSYLWLSNLIYDTRSTSPTANTVTTVTQKHLELQENHPKFLWAHQWPLPPSKLARSHLFFRPSPGPPPFPPLAQDPCSATPLTTTSSTSVYYDASFALTLPIFRLSAHCWKNKIPWPLLVVHRYIIYHVIFSLPLY